jgi:hypothetical protein
MTRANLSSSRVPARPLDRQGPRGHPAHPQRSFDPTQNPHRNLLATRPLIPSASDRTRRYHPPSVYVALQASAEQFGAFFAHGSRDLAAELGSCVLEDLAAQGGVDGALADAGAGGLHAVDEGGERRGDGRTFDVGERLLRRESRAHVEGSARPGLVGRPAAFDPAGGVRSSLDRAWAG